MLRNFEDSFQGFIPAEENQEHDEVRLERIKDIDSMEFNNFEQKVWEIWNKREIDHDKKYIEIFKIFFKSFCNKSQRQENINYENGQWIQGVLERMGLMGIPIDTLLRSTVTQITPPGTEKLRKIFNEKLSGCVVGAKSTIEYVDNRVRDRQNNVRLLTHSVFDKYYSTDIIEVMNFGPETIGEMSITQVKTQPTLSQKVLTDIHEDHVRLVEEFVRDSEVWNTNREDERIRNQEQINLLSDQAGDIELLISILREENPQKSAEEILQDTAASLGVELRHLHQSLLESININEVFDEIRPIIEYVQTLPVQPILEPVHNAIIPSRCRTITSRITNGSQLISEQTIIL